MNLDALIAGIASLCPPLDGKLRFERARYDERTQRATLFFLCDVLVDDGLFSVIKKEVAKALPGVRFSLRVASPALAPAFLANPAEFVHVLNPILARAHPAAVSWIPEITYLGENGALVLELPDDFSLAYFNDKAARELLTRAIDDVFRIAPPVVFRLKNDVQNRLERIEHERQAQRKLLSQTDPAKKTEKAGSGAAKSGKNKKIKGGVIADKPVPITGLTELSGRVTVAGSVVGVERRDIPGKEMVLLSFVLTDFSDSILCKIFLRYRSQRFKQEGEPVPPTAEERRQLEGVVASITKGCGLLVRGTCQQDSFDHTLVLMAADINGYDIPRREDNEPNKRIELHAHTHMSAMDATVSARDLIARAASWGHKAIAITDHGVVQAYPEAFSAAKEHGIKLIPGLEAFMIDSMPIVKFATDRPLGETIVVLDFETTGLNTRTDRIIEVGAVKLQHGHVMDTFSAMVNPGIPLPAIITQITGITDQMLRDAPSAAQVLPKLLDFIGDCPLAAHNAAFDCSMLKHELRRLDMRYKSPQLDTLFFAQKLYPQLKRFRLTSVCKHLGVSLRSAHRAVHDATATAQILAIMLEQAASLGAVTLADVDRLVLGYTKSVDRHVTILATSQQGLQNINRLVTAAHLQHFHYAPKVPRELIEQHREGLLIGSACAQGEIFEAFLHKESADAIEEIAAFYDFLEVQPVENYALLQKRGIVGQREDLVTINLGIIALGEKLGLPVIATGDVHSLEPEDTAFRTILHHSQRDQYADDLPQLHLRTTREMLDCFAYLDENKAREIVIDAPQRIVDQVEDITLYPKHPKGLTTFSPVWDTAEADIRAMVEGKSKELYGEVLPTLVRDRLDKELKAIIGYGYATLYSIANKLVSKSLSDGYVAGSRGSVGSSLVATMCGITEVNPLPPHYRCSACRSSDFNVPQGCAVGVDLPRKDCPACGLDMVRDGFDIPFEVFLGFEGDKVPDIDLNFSGDYQATAHAYVEDLFGEGYVYRAGTIGTLQKKTAEGLVLKYMEHKGKQFSSAEIRRLAEGCVGVKRTTGQHPGGIVVLPKDYDITQFTAVQHPSDDADKGVITTHYDFGSMHDILVKLDILGHGDPTMLHMLGRLTGVYYADVPLSDPAAMSLFLSPKALGVTSHDIDCPTGTLGVPEFGTGFVRQMLTETNPTTMEELIRIAGLSHGTDVWLGNARELIREGTATLRGCICTRDDIMLYLMQAGVPDKTAFEAMERVRKGKGLTPGMEQAMRENGVPDWYINSCNKIVYMFPKGHAVAYVTMALRVAWFKVHHPLAYYAAYFTIRSAGFNGATMLQPKAYIAAMLGDLKAMDSKELSGIQENEIIALEVVQEMLARGYAFLPPDLYKSDANEFLIEDGALRVPFGALNGFGVAAAQVLVEARTDPFMSIEDLKRRARINTSCIELLRDAGALKGLSDKNQIDLFSFL